MALGEGPIIGNCSSRALAGCFESSVALYVLDGASFLIDSATLLRCSASRLLSDAVCAELTRGGAVEVAGMYC